MNILNIFWKNTSGLWFWLIAPSTTKPFNIIFNKIRRLAKIDRFTTDGFEPVTFYVIMLSKDLNQCPLPTIINNRGAVRIWTSVLYRNHYTDLEQCPVYCNYGVVLFNKHVYMNLLVLLIMCETIFSIMLWSYLCWMHLRSHPLRYGSICIFM